MEYWQVDVFSNRPLAGNGLAVFPAADGLSAETMQELTRELRQFESIFLTSRGDRQVDARVFTMEEELPFAGHPVLGAAALCHHLAGGDGTAEWQIHLASKTVPVRTERQGAAISAVMNQGVATFGPTLSPDDADRFADAFSAVSDPRFRAQVVSTGLPYLVLPVTTGSLAAARQRRSVQQDLAGIGASFVYLLDVDQREGRTWDPDGVVEDIATGSAAGPVAAFMTDRGAVTRGDAFTINQGRFVGPDLGHVRGCEPASAL